MADIKFTADEKQVIVKKIKLYFQEAFEQEIGRFDAEFLLDFFAEEIGPYFYNRGLYEAQAILEAKLDEVQDAILMLEKYTEFKR